MVISQMSGEVTAVNILATDMCLVVHHADVKDADDSPVVERGENFGFPECSFGETIRWKLDGQNGVKGTKACLEDNPGCSTPQLFEEFVFAELPREWFFGIHASRPRAATLSGARDAAPSKEPSHLNNGEPGCVSAGSLQ